MNKKGFAVICLGLLALTWGLGVGAAEEKPTLLQKQAHWPAHLPEARVLHLAAISPTTHFDRLLYSDEAGVRLASGTSFRASEGVEESYLVDEVTGAWVALTVNLPFQGDTLDELFAAHHRDDRVYSIPLTLRSSTGLEIELRQGCGDWEAYHANFIGLALTPEDRSALAKGFSPGAKQALEHLSTSLADLHSTYEPGPVEGAAPATLLKVLGEAVAAGREDDTAESDPHPMVVEFSGKGEHLLPFAERFLIETSFSPSYLEEPLRVPVPDSAFVRAGAPPTVCQAHPEPETDRDSASSLQSLHSFR